jgi:OmcA/MtrC family decaheme c-type cytochrome
MFKRATRLAAVVAAIAAAGCSGSDGAQGPTGPQGSQGPVGPAGPVSTTNEACVVCHASDRIAPIGPSHTLPFSTGEKPNTNVTVTAVRVTAAGKFAVDFTAADPAGAVTIDVSEFTNVIIAGYDPNTVTTGGKGWFVRGLREQPSKTAPFTVPGTLTGDSSGYTYTMAAAAAVPAGTVTERVYLEIAKAGHNYGNGFYDFDATGWTAPTATTFASAANPRDIVPTAVCNKCHVDRIGDFGHNQTSGPMMGSGARIDTRACVICHSPLTNPSYIADRADFPSFIHRIHSAIPTKVTGADVTYPGDMKECTFCHQGGTASDRYKTNPNKQACSSCHTTVDFTNHHGFGTPADGAGCLGCHGAGATWDIDKVHSLTPASGDPTYDVSLAPEYVVSMSITPPANGTYYVANEAPVVTIQLVENGTLWPAANYGQGKDVDAQGNTNPGVQNDKLTNAGLYVYGPRSNPMPVLTTGSAKTPVPTQSQSLLLPSSDPLVATTTAGAGAFVYKLKPIPSTMTPGTYMVRFYAQDYGYVNDSNFRVSSNAFQTIQILQAAVTPKISGDCTRCHGSANAPFHDARHAVPFNTDECESCHDYSGNHANLLANRVHSVHAGSKLGDLMSLDWTTTTSYELDSGVKAGPITYPVGDVNGGIQNCAVCHSSGNPQYTQNVHEQSCRGCHMDIPAAQAHMLQNGGK